MQLFSFREIETDASATSAAVRLWLAILINKLSEQFASIFFYSHEIKLRLGGLAPVQLST